MIQKHIYAALAAVFLTLALNGCGRNTQSEIISTETCTAPTETVAATVPADGDPNDVTCKGSYTEAGDPPQAAAARIGDAALTNEQLSAYYWAEAAAYRQSGETPAPDWSRPLDTQVCEKDESVASWQQYFLRRALNTWHSSQALILQGNEEGLPVEEAYQPSLDNYEKYMQGMPATQFLYRYQKAFQPNTMHQAYLDAIPETLEALAAQKGYDDASQMAQTAFGVSLDALKTFMEAYNRGYMYYTNLSYYIEPTAEELEAARGSLSPEDVSSEESLVDIRHILLLPEEGAAEPQWEACMAAAEDLLQSWQKDPKASEATFADLANKNSQDPGTALDGGGYQRIRQGQLLEELDAWCFAPDRAVGDTAVIRSSQGVHILYLSKRQSGADAMAEDLYIADKQADILTTARRKYPISIDYSAISLSLGEAAISLNDLLYPDIAHERFPEMPLYLQQDYPRTMYGGFPIRTNGCGITTMSMLATYMTDDELTPPEMCALYGKYSFRNGTDGTIFVKEPPVLGFYFREKTYEPTVAHQALEDGHIVVSVQHKGYWTKGGHYIALEKLNADGTIQVRDSNLYNYGRISSHANDCHTWSSITSAGSGFWIFEKKVTAIPACSRCGDPASLSRSILREDYLCRKCEPALLRWDTYLAQCGSQE